MPATSARISRPARSAYRSHAIWRSTTSRCSAFMRSQLGQPEEAAAPARALRVERDGWPGDCGVGGRWSATARIHSLGIGCDRADTASETGGVIKSPLLYR